MNEYKLIGLTDYAKEFLSDKELEGIESMIGCTIYERDYPSGVDGGRLFCLPDGEDAHEVFLLIEKL